VSGEEERSGDDPHDANGLDVDLVSVDGHDSGYEHGD